jgi:RND family efflux transporter MFP subunit
MDLDRLRKDNAVLRDLEAQARVETERAEADVVRNRALFEQRIIDEARWRVFEAAAKTAQAALAASSSRVAAGTASETSWGGEIARRAAALLTADAEIARAGDALRQAEILLDKTYVRAPFAGLVVHKDAELGEVVAATGAGGNSRGSVATIVDPKTLEVQVELSETRLGSIAQGDATRIVLDAAPDRSFRGRIRQVWPTADRQKATVEMRIEFLEWPDIVKPEMGARVTFLGKDGPSAPEQKRLPKVPARAVVRKGDQAAVFVLAGGRVRRTDVRLGAEAGGLIEVEGGLAGGEQVVLDPPVDLVDGAAVSTKGAKDGS